MEAGESVKVTVLLRRFFEGAELRVGTSSLADRQGCREPCEGRLSELDAHQDAQNQSAHRYRGEGEDRRLTRQYLRRHEQDRNRCESSDYDSAETINIGPGEMTTDRAERSSIVGAVIVVELIEVTVIQAGSRDGACTDSFIEAQLTQHRT
ncbi:MULTISPECIES: hypothetical protein [unclassified Rhodococcus (in: high G+C Gram-positive bacteria)]|uniref:hypothetical protein n=1 Tax=unclassified Rhodococcus (in: high G+C Gram-positive bacteria) TaxID=192944 RepID=UPI001145139C|nr:MULTISPECIES: hypothetical protein [unclassified Rhodococcus (in: high G+C Gram-positive bacteria)]TQC34338.1 hypothetical protein EEB16_29590 [Rhodococcus sp. WS7]